MARIGGDAGTHPRGDCSGAAGDVFRETLRYWLADGTERLVDFGMHPILDGLGTVRFLHPTGIDITDDASEAEQRFRSLVSIVTDVPLDSRLDGSFPSLRSRRGASYTGQSQEEYQGLGWLDAVHPDDQAIRAYRVGPGDGERRPLSGDRTPLARASPGSTVTSSPRATPVRSLLGGVDEWVGACTDIHERTLADEALRAQEAEEREIAIGLQRALLPERLVSSPRARARGALRGRQRRARGRRRLVRRVPAPGRAGRPRPSATSSATVSPRPPRWGSCAPRSRRSPSMPSRRASS